jgi:hypothetical protein
MHWSRLNFRDLLIAVGLLLAVATTLQGCGGGSSSGGQDPAPHITMTTSSLPNGQVGTAYSMTLVACAWRIVIVASFERNVTMLHWRKPLNGIFGRHRTIGHVPGTVKLFWDTFSGQR